MAFIQSAAKSIGNDATFGRALNQRPLSSQRYLQLCVDRCVVDVEAVTLVVAFGFDVSLAAASPAPRAIASNTLELSVRFATAGRPYGQYNFGR